MKSLTLNDVVRKVGRKIVAKKWGKELWLVNTNLYCAKVLVVNRGRECSYHCHKVKTETFIGLEGIGKLNINGEEFDLSPHARGKTIFPGEYHSFKALTKLRILEVSTHHDDNDVHRLTESK